MFTSILNFLGYLWSLFYGFVKGFSDLFWTVVRFNLFALVTITGAVIASLATAYNLVGVALGQVDAAMGVANGVTPAGSLGGAIGFINYMFPLQETFTYLGVWLEIQVAMFIYRFIKSWIPTVSG